MKTMSGKWRSPSVEALAPLRERLPATRLEIAGVVYSWAACLVVVFMVSLQFFGAIFGSTEMVTRNVIGNRPELGPYATGKTNDVPYSDRIMACVLSKNKYQPTLISDLLEETTPAFTVIDSSGTDVSGYRVVSRTGATLDSTASSLYSHVCDVAAATMDNIVTACGHLGYNVTRDGLRVVDGVSSNRTLLIQNSLPLLMMPFYDNSPSARYVLPGWDGSACVLRLSGKYTSEVDPHAIIRGVNRSIRETKTPEWLQKPGGTWRNGWYEDAEDMKWYSDIVTTHDTLYTELRSRYFDGLTAREIDCDRTTLCQNMAFISQWAPKFTLKTSLSRTLSVVMYNGTQYGIFFYDGITTQTLSSKYDWETAVSNMTVLLLVFRWFVAMIALHRGYFEGKTRLHSMGIGALSSSLSFRSLPLLLLPRLKIILLAFCSVGCAFQGQQIGFAETWFVIYPAITELTLFYYSVLNVVAKILRRRMTDALFTPTILALSAIHFSRYDIVELKWLHVADGWITTLVTSDEMKQLSLVDFFSSNIALRLNGNVSRLFIIKLAVLGVSLLPLLFAKQLSVQQKIPKSLAGIERALAVRASNVAGLGRSQVYWFEDGSSAAKGDMVHPICQVALNSYEIIRLGCVVYGGKYLITMDDWDRVSMLVGFRHFYHLWNHRVVVFELHHISGSTHNLEVAKHPTLVRVDAPELLKISVWNISSRSICC